MITAHASLLNVQGAVIQKLCFQSASLRVEACREVRERVADFSMLGSEMTFEDR